MPLLAGSTCITVLAWLPISSQCTQTHYVLLWDTTAAHIDVGGIAAVVALIGHKRDGRLEGGVADVAGVGTLDLQAAATGALWPAAHDGVGRVQAHHLQVMDNNSSVSQHVCDGVQQHGSCGWLW
jgi:hypothetical protein